MHRLTLGVAAVLLGLVSVGAIVRWSFTPAFWLSCLVDSVLALLAFLWLRRTLLRPLGTLQMRLTHRQTQGTGPLPQTDAPPGIGLPELTQAVGQLLADLDRLAQEVARLREYSTTLSRTAQAIVVGLDADLHLISLNEYGQTLAGTDPQHFAQADIARFFTAGELESLRSELETKDAVIGREMSLLTHNGDQLDAEMSVSRLRNDRGQLTGYLGVIVDVTKRKRAETNLRNQIAFSQQIFSSIPEMILITDRNLRVTFCNRQARELLARSDLEVIGQSLTQQLSAEALESGFDEVVRQVITKGQRISQINVRNPFVGEEQFVDLLIEPLRSATARIGSLILIRDISEWRQLTAQLRSLQGFTQRLVNASPFAVISLDSQARISVWNATAERMFHLPFSEVFGKNLYEAVPPFLPLRDVIDDVAILQKTVHRNDETFTIAPQEDLVANVTIYPVTAEESGVVLHLEDVSALRELESTLLQAQKMESLGLLTSGIIHDFNNLLSGILGYASLLEQRLEGDDKLQKYASTIIHSSERASDLIRQLLDYARKKVAEKAAIPLNELLRESLEFLAPHLKTIKVEQQLAPDELVVHADRGKLSQVFINLTINAKDATEGCNEPTITITTSRVELHDHPHLPDGSYAKIMIADNGCGISPQNLEKIFEPFFTTKKVGRGTGLGLSLVQGIIRDYAGHIEISSEVGVGTRIYLFLPVGELPRPITTVSPEAVAEPSQVGTVLLIDDEEVVREIGTDMLHLGGISCLSAADGEEGLALFQEHRSTIGLIILDIEMPRMSGEKVFSSIRQVDADMPVLIASGYSKEYLESKVFGRKIDHYIPKPFKIEQLLHQVRNLSRVTHA